MKLYNLVDRENNQNTTGIRSRPENKTIENNSNARWESRKDGTIYLYFAFTNDIDLLAES